jgi:hypothetical protein
MNLRWPKDAATWVGLVGVLAGAVYHATQGQYEAAWAMLAAALAMLGIGQNAATAAAEAHAAATQATFAAADARAIRDDPSLPGAPLGAAERAIRDAAGGG